MAVIEHLTLLAVYLQFLAKLVTGQVCGAGLVLTYAKIPNMIPRTAQAPVLLYAQAPGVGITATCYNRCRDTPNCDGFIMDYKQGACFRVSVGRQYEDYQHQPTVNFFRKVCLKLPAGCRERAWPVEYVPGYKLLAEQQTVLPNIADKWQCAQICLSRGDLPCRSSQYQAWSRTCTLSHHDRHTNPESFSPTVTSDREFEYMEVQCSVAGRSPDSLSKAEDCWRDPVYNRTSMRADLEVDNLTSEQCEWRCQKEVSFRCSAYTFQCPAYGNRVSRCLLHSDQLQSSAGPLLPMPCTTYRERISCVDVRVSCSPTSLEVTLQEPMFTGQMFVSGHAAECSAANTGQDQVLLAIPLPQADYAPNKCDVQVVRPIGGQNRTIVSAVVVIQHHKLIQTVSDRVIKVSCYLDTNNQIAPTPQYNNLTLNASFFVKDPLVVQNVIEGYGKNNATYPPSAEMRVVDVGRGGNPASQIDLGDELELQIFVNPSYNVSMIRAGHLIASSGSGQDSLLLLDWRGCPPDPTTFPALAPANSSALVARFRAFKFPDSNILRFSVILTFCVSVCQPTDCGNGMTSYGKRRRRRAVEEVMEEVPLQLEIIVKTPGTKTESPPKHQLSDNDTDLAVVDEESETVRHDSKPGELVCASLGTMLLGGAAWVALQLLLLISCCWVLGRRHRHADRDQLTKHVSWGDSLNHSHVNSSFEDSKKHASATKS